MFHKKKKKSQKAYLGVVNLSSNKEGESRSESLFEVHTNLTRAVNLSPERSHPKVVLGTQSCQSFPLGRAQHGLRSEDGLEVKSDVDLVGKLLIVSRLDVTVGLEVAGSCPTGDEGRRNARGGRGKGGNSVGQRSEFGDIRGGGLENGGFGMLDHSLETKREPGRDGMKKGSHVDTGKVEEVGVDGFPGEGVVVSDVVVFELNHGVAGLVRNLSLNLGEVSGRPSLVGTHGQRAGTVETTLQEGLRQISLPSSSFMLLVSQRTLALAKMTPKL